MKKFKSLASTHIRKIAILLVISTLPSTILCSCGDDKNSTQIETMIEEETEETTTQKPDEAKDEKTERQNQDADPTEEADKETAHQSNDTKPSTQHTNQSAEPTTQAHVHNFKPETYYTTETQTVHHDAVTHTVHHDAVTHQETKYKTETIERDGYMCDDGAFFENEGVAAEYCSNHGGIGYCSWKQTETVQVPYTETVVDQAAYDETVTDKPAWDEEVEVQVPHTREVCSCGATK